MTYNRVIPRDLFNEASLLKCYGRLWILLDERHGHRGELEEPDAGEPFEVMQNEATGGITIANVPFLIAGYNVRLERPLNSRSDWPLYAIDVETDEETAVFDDQGNFTPEFWELIGL